MMRSLGWWLRGGVGLSLAVACVLFAGCGSDMADGGVDGPTDGTSGGDGAVAAPLPGRDGVDGLSCWDLDGDGVRDPEEDINGDGEFDASDCRGADASDGEPGAEGADGLAGTDGLNCWDLNGNGQGDAAEDINGDGVLDALDCQTAGGQEGSPGSPGATGGTGADGPAGPPGTPGPEGPEFFSTTIDDFFAADPAVDGELPILLDRIDNPLLGSSTADTPVTQAVAFQVSIPESYDIGHDISLRLFLIREAPNVALLGEDSCFVFTMDGLRLRNGLSADAYGSRRWVRVDLPERPAENSGDSEPEVLLVIDLPVNRASGLGYPDDLRPGDLVVFEMSTHASDGGAYHVAAAELFESETGSAVSDGGRVFDRESAVRCFDCEGGLPDCNGNGLLDRCDIDDGTSDDCNGNGVPDECDLCQATSGQAAAATTTGPFTFLQAGFTQEVFATSPNVMGGVAFAADGDVLVDSCLFSGSDVRRFDAQTRTTVNGSRLRPLVASLASNAGCGLTNHPNGTLYSNIVDGVTHLDLDTGVELDEAFGAPGNALGIAADPLTGDLVYVGDDGTLLVVDDGFTSSGVFSTATTGDVIHGIVFDPSGQFLVCANLTRSALTIVDRSGMLVQEVPVAHGGTSRTPSTLAFLSNPPATAVTLNLDGSMTRFDFPGGDLAAQPAQSLFADGGFRGDLAQVGPDGCLYLTQVSTRFGDGTVRLNERSLIRLCGGFESTLDLRGPISLEPQAATVAVGSNHTLRAAVNDNGTSVAGADVHFEVLSGPNRGVTGTAATGADGLALLVYTGLGGAGTDVIEAWVETDRGIRYTNTVSAVWFFDDCSIDCNGNGTPDECELEGNDCNGNGVLDECDGGCGG